MSVKKLSEACWQALGQKAPKEIALASLSAECEVPYQHAVIYGGSVIDLIIQKIAALDCEALATSADDFADDPHASIYEKLLEGLMMRFEILAAHRAQFDHLHEGAKQNPILAAHLLHQLSDVVGKLLTLAGDETTGLIKQARILGVVGVLLRVRPVWSQDDSADLGLTMKALDKELKKACEWALSLRILSQDDLAKEGGASDE